MTIFEGCPLTPDGLFTSSGKVKPDWDIEITVKYEVASLPETLYDADFLPCRMRELARIGKILKKGECVNCISCSSAVTRIK